MTTKSIPYCPFQTGDLVREVSDRNRFVLTVLRATWDAHDNAFVVVCERPDGEKLAAYGNELEWLD